MGVAILGRYLYVVGGNSSHQEVLKSVERYSFDEDKWESVSPMSVPRASPAVAAVDGFLYVAGGDQVRGEYLEFFKTKLISNFICFPDTRSKFLSCTDHDKFIRMLRPY